MQECDKKLTALPRHHKSQNEKIPHLKINRVKLMFYHCTLADIYISEWVNNLKSKISITYENVLQLEYIYANVQSLSKDEFLVKIL